MKIKKSIDYHEKVFFCCIILSLIPFVIDSVFLISIIKSDTYMVISGIIFIIQIMIVVFSSVHLKPKINLPLLLFAVFYAITYCITLVISLMNGSINVYDFFYLFARIAALLILLIIPSGLTISKKGVNWFYRKFLLIVIIASFYNLIVNFQNILNIGSFTNVYQMNFSSFFLNRNSFAQFLWLGAISAAYLIESGEKKIVYWFSYILILINVLLTFSRTSIALVLFIGMVIILNTTKPFTKLILSYATLIILSLFLSVGKINMIINSYFLRKSVGTSGRSELWYLGIDLISNLNVLFGLGYFSSTQLVIDLGKDLKEFHSFYVETLVGGGIFDLILMIGLLFMVIHRLIRIEKSKLILNLSVYFTLMVYCIFESASFFNMGYVPMLFTIFFITIPIIKTNSTGKRNAK